MAWLKALVIGMGVLIVAGIGVVAVTLVNRMGGTVSSSAVPSTAATTAGRIELPPGARIAETHVEGNSITIRYTMPDGRSYIDVYEPQGRLVMKIEIGEQK